MSTNSRRKEPVRLNDYQPTHYAITETHLSFNLAPQKAKITAKLHVERRDGMTPGMAMKLAGDDLSLVALRIDGKEVSEDAYSCDASHLTLNSPPSDPFVLEIDTEVNPKSNKQLMGLYRSGSAYCTQCEAEGFRRITYFYDRPDVLSVYTVRIEADKAEAPQLLSNGNLIESGDMPDNAERHFAVWHDPFPKPSYLFALVAGDLAFVEDSFKTMSGRNVVLRIYVEHGNEDKCDYAMDALKRSMKWDEERFGREYDLDIFMIVAVSDFNMGAMENKGLNVFNDRYVLADPQIATDQDYAGVERVIAHEYFHNWTGNRITCRDWFQLCLKEGLTVFRDQEFSADMRSAPVQRIGDVRTLKARQFPEDQGPLAHPVRPVMFEEIDNFYTATIYNKGAELIRMLETILGREGFRSGMDLYFERHDGEATTIEAFLDCFEEANVADLSQFSWWYNQAGTPIVGVKEIQNGDNSRQLFFTQRYSELPHLSADRPPLVIPLKLAYVGEDGQDIELDVPELKEGFYRLKSRISDLTIKNIPLNARLSINRGFSAPVILEQSQSDEDQIFLAARDSDPFNRWQAYQNLAMSSIRRVYDAVLEEKKPEGPIALATAAASLLQDTELDPSFKALCLSIPAPQELARSLKENVFPDAVASAQAYVKAYVSLCLKDELTKLYHSLHKENDTATDGETAARRSLKNTVLDLMVASDSSDAADIAVAQVKSAANMTDRMGAMMALCRQGRRERGLVLAEMYDQFQDNGLVMDKWLSLQALVNSTDTLSTVRALLHDPVFSYSNPNRVRSLIGAFSGNYTQFNRMDGGGYQFLARQVGMLDGDNPQIAARLLEGLSTWQQLEPGRQALAKKALERLSEQNDLSSNVSDITHRLLGND